jgi:hypothetical protein
MSQRNVERVIGRLVTDENFRRQFSEDPRAALEEMRRAGVELTPVETQALLSVDPDKVGRLSECIDARLQKIGRCGCGS